MYHSYWMRKLVMRFPVLKEKMFDFIAVSWKIIVNHHNFGHPITYAEGPIIIGKLLCPISIMSIWVCGGLVKLEL